MGCPEIDALLNRLGSCADDELPRMLEMIAAALERARCRMMHLALEGQRPRGRLLKPLEAAELLGVTPRWMYDHAPGLKSTRRPSPGKLRFDEAELRREID